MLTKTRTVLEHVDTVERGPVFGGVEDDGDRLTTVTLDLDVWLDMGSPRTITVTIRPGDRLNS